MGGDKYIGAPKSIARGDGRRRTPPLFQSRVTPVTELPVGGSVLWVKRDDETHELYGGNKVRKLSAILSELAAEGSEKIVTVGAAGSHHVLATCLFGAAHGFHVIGHRRTRTLGSTPIPAPTRINALKPRNAQSIRHRN